MAVEGDVLVHEIRIDASPATVFAFFTDPARHVQWLGREADLDPRPGGHYRCVVNDSATIVGMYVEVQPPYRVVFTWGFDGNPGVPPGTSTVTVTLSADGAGTLLRLEHTGLPHPALEPHDVGWTGYLDQLAEVSGPTGR